MKNINIIKIWILVIGFTASNFGAAHPAKQGDVDQSLLADVGTNTNRSETTGDSTFWGAAAEKVKKFFAQPVNKESKRGLQRMEISSTEGGATANFFEAVRVSGQLVMGRKLQPSELNRMDGSKVFLMPNDGDGKARLGTVNLAAGQDLMKRASVQVSDGSYVDPLKAFSGMMATVVLDTAIPGAAMGLKVLDNAQYAATISSQLLGVKNALMSQYVFNTSGQSDRATVIGGGDGGGGGMGNEKGMGR